MIDKRPAAIARCRDVADVIACVRFGREHGAGLAIRGGGHNVAGVDPANAGLIAQWTRDYWEELHPTSAGGAYVNFLMDEGRDRVKAPTAATTTRSPRSSGVTTPATSSMSTRTLSRPASRIHSPCGR
jgi:hypothetical protein